MKLSLWDRVSEAVESGKLRALNDNVLVRLLPMQQQGDVASSSLLVLPDTAKHAVNRGALAEVVAVGPGHVAYTRTRPERQPNRGDGDTSPRIHRRFVPTTVRPGEVVVLESQLSGDVWPLRSGEHRMVREAEIEATITL